MEEKKNKPADEKETPEEKHEQEIQKDIENIYNSNGSDPAETGKLNIRKASWMKRVLLIQAGIAIVLLAAIAAFLFFGNGGNDEETSLDVEFDIPEEIISGAVSTFFVNYKNTESHSLKDVEFTFRFPEIFEFVSSDPPMKNEFQDRIYIGNLLRGQSGMIAISGTLMGDVGDLFSIGTTASFQPQNFSSIFKEEFISETRQITTSVISLEVEGPRQVTPGQQAEYTIIYENSTEGDLSDALIVVTFPESFSVLTLVPEPEKPSEDGQQDTSSLRKTWKISDLKKGESGTIQIAGEFRDTEVESHELIVEAGQQKPNHEFQVFQKDVVELEYISHGLKLDLAINGVKEDSSVSFSDALNYSLTYKNLGRETLYDITLTVDIASDVLDWDTLIDSNHGQKQAKSIAWTKEEIPILAVMRPLQEETLEFSVRIKDIRDVDIERSDLKTISIAKANIKKVGDLKTEIRVNSKSIENKINTQLEMNASGRYFSEDNIAVGQGPLPPKVGEKTTFRIYWEISNNLHEVKDVKVKTELPLNIVWEDKFLTSVGVLEYDPRDNTVTWKIPKILPNKGFDELNAWFDIAVIPEERDAGKLLLLTKESILSAVDTVTNSGVAELSRSITSNLEDDEFGGGRGLVVGGSAPTTDSD